jgi:hypothetical protein
MAKKEAIKNCAFNNPFGPGVESNAALATSTFENISAQPPR